jgi:hypothetical protein
VFPLRNLFCRRPWWRVSIGLRAVLAVGALVVALAGHGQSLVAQPFPTDSRDDPGQFVVRSADATLRDGVYFLSAAIEYRLSSDAQMALRSGVPLMIRLDVEIIEPRRWWFDNTRASLRQLWQLEWHALSERFVVLNRNSGNQASFGSLSSALSYLGRVENLPVIDAALLDPDDDYDLRIRAALDVEQLSGPLRLLAFWRRDWSIASDWYRWPLRND